MSCPEGLCGPEEVDAYQVPPRTGADTLSVGVLKTQQFVAWFGLFVPRGTVQFTDSSLLILWMFPLYRCWFKEQSLEMFVQKGKQKGPLGLWGWASAAVPMYWGVWAVMLCCLMTLVSRLSAGSADWTGMRDI